MPPPDESAAIRDLNDAFRRTFSGGRVVLTAIVAALPATEREGLLQKVRSFHVFERGDDPYGEHDFGAVEHEGERYFWKIDYLVPELTAGSEYPADSTKTTRVLTIMRADDY
jgi:hypothetical protein